MPPLNPVVISRLWMSCGILLIASFLGLWQWFDKRSRDPEPNPDDREFFRRQDRRRFIGISLMAVLAGVVFAESLFPEFRKRLALIASWCAVVFIIGALIIALITLARFDWVATREYARRHRRALNRERSKLMLDMIHRSGSSDSGRGSSEEKTKQ